MATEFGDFLPICRNAMLPICNLLITAPPTCTQKRLMITADQSIGNIADLAVSVVTFLMMFIVLFKTYTKFAAVGRKEMNILFFWYMLILVVQIVTTADFLPRPSVVLSYLSAIQIGLIVAFFWTLFINGLVGYQLMEDGTAYTTYSTLISGILVAAGASYIAIDTAYGYSKFFGDGVLNNSTGSFLPYNETSTKSIPLFVLYIVWPIVASGLYFVLQLTLVMKDLGQRKPLIWLTLTAVLFAGSQVLRIAVSNLICTAANNLIDGSFLSTFVSFLAIVVLFVYWSSITEDEWDEMDEV